jgi:hypothetical protein
VNVEVAPAALVMEIVVEEETLELFDIVDLTSIPIFPLLIPPWPC